MTDPNDGALTCNEKLEGEIVLSCFQGPCETQNNPINTTHKNVQPFFGNYEHKNCPMWLCNQRETCAGASWLCFRNEWERMLPPDVTHAHLPARMLCLCDHMSFSQTSTAKTKPVVRNAGSDRVAFQLQGCLTNSQDWGGRSSADRGHPRAWDPPNSTPHKRTFLCTLFSAVYDQKE